MNRSVYLGAVAVVWLTTSPVTVIAQTAIAAEGLVESTTGGFKFPDGSVQTTAAGGGAPVEDTGQTECFDQNGDSRDCMGTGEDGESQAGVAWPTPRFAGNADGTVTDNLTGLIWLELANCFGAQDWATALSFTNNLDHTQCGLSDGSQAGDWRLPNIKELLSLVDYSQSNPALPSDHIFVDVGVGFYWSSSSDITLPERAWGVSMASGNDTSITKVPFDGHRFWPVRGGQ